ncbi:MAG: SGNH/GDSL hydrolase family protein [Butyrivibrio sp.]|uniref:SGNH/GDSL hydrolase family protein n=1 Tax=Butyrivibrio sp. TaxID=28121 RepID=UPI0025C67819|nr:SGNH/GDSL hydrolase family protein [Butyrivibrio sp.]MBQ6587370.1 SGNH/GDSL hydrolase family protein [Butyrivibrio sp.]
MALDDNVDYDLVVLCYGQNDIEENISLYYEAMIRADKNRYPKASLLAILESSQKEYTLKMQTIQDIASRYSIPVVDTIAPLQKNYESLTADAVHPNDDGYKVYCETTMNTINDLVAESYGFDPNDISPVNDRVAEFDEFQWIGSEQFTRDNNTFTFNTSLQGDILGIDYDFISGANSCKIIIDGEEYAAPEVSFDYDFSQRHIMVVNNWLDGDVVDVKNEIKVVFADDENGQKQADGFRGLAISG